MKKLFLIFLMAGFLAVLTAGICFAGTTKIANKGYNSPFLVEVKGPDGVTYTSTQMATITRARLVYVPADGEDTEYVDSEETATAFDWTTYASTGNIMVDPGLVDLTTGHDTKAELVVYDSTFTAGRVVAYVDIYVDSLGDATLVSAIVASITLTGGSTGDVLTQQENGSFAPETPTTGAVDSVNGETGAVTVTEYDITGKTADTPADADEFGFWDTVAGVFRKISYSNLKTALDSVFATDAELAANSTTDQAYADANDDVDDADADATNEINTLTADDAGTTTGLDLTLSGAGIIATSRSGDTILITGTEVDSVIKNLYDAGTILYATSDNTPEAKTVAQFQAIINLDDLVTLSGVNEGAADLGTFTGSTISDNVTIKAALQALETAVEAAAGGHDAVTLSTSLDTILSLTTQELGLDTQSANTVLAGPTSGAAAVPAFRALVDADIPAAIARDSELPATTDDLAEGSTNKYDQTVANTGDADIQITGTYPNFTFSFINGSGFLSAITGTELDNVWISNGILKRTGAGTYAVAVADTDYLTPGTAASTYHPVWDYDFGDLINVPSGLADGDDDTTYSAGTGLGLTGTTFSLSHLGIESLVDPNGDAMIFWDDSAGATAWLNLNYYEQRFSSSVTGLVKSDGAGNLSAAVAGTDYVATESDPGVTTHEGAADPHTGYMLESNIGTGANNYVQLNGSGALPAVDGSNLTGVSGGGITVVNTTTTETVTTSSLGNNLATLHDQGATAEHTTTLEAPSTSFPRLIVKNCEAIQWNIAPPSGNYFILDGTAMDANDILVNAGAAALDGDMCCIFVAPDTDGTLRYWVENVRGFSDGGVP